MGKEVCGDRCGESACDCREAYFKQLADDFNYSHEKKKQLQSENETLRAIALIQDPEQHFEQLMVANKELQSELDKRLVEITEKGENILSMHGMVRKLRAELDRVKEVATNNNKVMHRLVEESDKGIKHLATELEKHRWIPVGERLPDKHDLYDVYDGRSKREDS